MENDFGAEVVKSGMYEMCVHSCVERPRGLHLARPRRCRIFRCGVFPRSRDLFLDHDPPGISVQTSGNLAGEAARL